MVKNLGTLVSALFILLVLASAAEEPRNNFGTAQAGNTLAVVPGEETVGELYFYNVYGNKITFVTLELGEAVPHTWKVAIDPPLRNITYTVAGVEALEKANVYVEPSNFVTVPESLKTFRCGDMDCKYIPSPAGGYMLAKIVYVRVTPPANEQLFRDFPIVVNAKAFWHGEPGMVTAQQVRTFSYTAHTTTKNLDETIVTPQAKLDLSQYYWVVGGLILLGAAYYFGQKSGKKR